LTCVHRDRQAHINAMPRMKAWFSPAIAHFHELELRWLEQGHELAANVTDNFELDYFFVDSEAYDQDPYVAR
jgi:hypothetical protein